MKSGEFIFFLMGQKGEWKNAIMLPIPRSCRLSDLLLAGAIMNQMLQPHEAHIPFPLQVSHTSALPSKAPAWKYSHLYLTSVHDWLQFVWNELHPSVSSEISTGRRLAHFVFWIPLFIFFWSSTYFLHREELLSRLPGTAVIGLPSHTLTHVL